MSKKSGFRTNYSNTNPSSTDGASPRAESPARVTDSDVKFPSLQELQAIIHTIRRAFPETVSPTILLGGPYNHIITTDSDIQKSSHVNEGRFTREAQIVFSDM